MLANSSTAIGCHDRFNMNAKARMNTSTLPPVVQGAVYGVVLNDRRSLAKLGDALVQPPYKGAPQAPVLYIKPANTLSGSGASVVLPAGAGRLEIGATLGVVIGAPAARLSLESAASAIAGYVVVADLSLPHTSYYRPAIREKCFDGSCPMSPAIVPAGLVGDPGRLRVDTCVNGAEVDSWPLGDLLRSVPELLRDVSEFMTLRVGDMLLVGVPWQAPEAVAGDEVRVVVAGVGEVGFRVVANESGVAA